MRGKEKKDFVSKHTFICEGCASLLHETDTEGDGNRAQTGTTYLIPWMLAQQEGCKND